MERRVPERAVRPEEYAPFVGAGMVEAMQRLAEPLAGTSWANINSTFSGGGVAEMLRSVLPLAAGLGIDAQWWAIEGDEAFFKVTKKFHNLLQGKSESLSLEEVFGSYLDTIEQNARRAHIAADVIEIHDPQPTAMIMSGVLYGNLLWRCHIDTSNPDKVLWRFLLPYINQCAGAVFTLPEFAGPGLNIPHYQVYPSIDPLAEKNRQLSDAEALEILAPIFEKNNIDPGRPIIAAVSRYDPHKNQGRILEAFRLLRSQGAGSPPPYLIYLGNTASDDPEGESILADLRGQAGDDPDVRMLVNVEDNDRIVGALMHIARVSIQVSTREGFGLVVSEAAWQGTPVIGSTAGGISHQVLDGETGYVVDPYDVEALATKMRELIEDQDLARAMGEAGRELVRRNFLLPSMLMRYLSILRFYTGKSRSLPDHRIDSLSYREILDHVVSPRHGWRESRTSDDGTLDAASSNGVNGSTYLVVAHETAGSPQLQRTLTEIQGREPDADFVVLVPEVPGHGNGVSDSIGQLEAAGVRIGRVDVNNDGALTALENELANEDNHFKGIVLSTFPSGMSSWLASGLLDKARGFGPPVFHVVSLKNNTPPSAPSSADDSQVAG